VTPHVLPPRTSTMRWRYAREIIESTPHGTHERSRFLGYVLLRCGHTMRKRSPGAPTNRTQLIRDLALATGSTCIACGRDAMSNVGKYPVCPRHEKTVQAPHPNWKWKNNVRTRHARRMGARACAWCGRRRGLTRHHDWSKGGWGHPPRPVVLCRRCHRIADSGSVTKVWSWRLKLIARHCKPLLRLLRLSVF
jgi:hypothetical protein